MAAREKNERNEVEPTSEPTPARELLVKSRAISVMVPRSLKFLRSYYLPRYRRTQHHTSISAAESQLLADSLGYLRGVLKKLPRNDWLYEHFSEAGREDRFVALELYTKKMKDLFAPSRWQIPVSRLVIHLYEQVASALSELVMAYSLPYSFVYSLGLTYALSQLPSVSEKDRQELDMLRKHFEGLIESAQVWVQKIDALVGLPAYLRVAMLLEPQKAYDIDALSVLAMSAGVVHAGVPRSQRNRLLVGIVARLIDEGYLKEIPNRKDLYVCVRSYSDEYPIETSVQPEQ